MSRTSRRTGLGALVAALVLFGLAVPAWAYFSVSSSAATSAGRAAVLGTPSVATSNVTSSSVTFTVTAPPTGPTPTGYRVARTAPTTVATVCTVTGATGSCTDPSPASGQTNTYAVYAVLSGTSWESPTPATTSAAVPGGDTTAPSVTLTTPANNVSLNSVTPVLSGAAGAAVGDLATVTVKIFNGTGTAGAVAQTLSTTRSGATWSVPAATLVEGTYTALASQADAAGNVGTSSANTFVIDTTKPAVTLTTPANSATVNVATPALSGAAGNLAGDSATVTVKVYSGPTAAGSPIQTLTPGRTGATWSATATTLPQGTYTAVAAQTDAAGNTGTSSATTFTIDTPPSVSGIALANSNGGLLGTVNQDDTVTIRYSEQMDATRFCSTWTNGGTQTLNSNGDVVVTINNVGSNDTLSVSSISCSGLTIGTISLGGNYVDADATFSGSGSNVSSVSLTTNGVLTITLGKTAQGALPGSVPAGTPTYTPASTLRDVTGNALPVTSFTGGSSRF